jgi:DNA-binding IclR family transcriptional regulator
VPKESVSGVASVERAVSILAAFERGTGTLTLNDLAGTTGLYKSTILRLIASLERHGCIVRLSDGRYQLGARIFHWGNVYLRSLRLEDHVVPALERLVQSTGESASFYTRHGDQRLCLYRHDSPRSVRDHVRAGDLLPLDRGAAGRVLREYSESEGKRPRVHVVSSLGERDSETAALAIPVFGATEALKGALSVSGPLARFTDASVATIAKAITEVARGLTERLGGDASVYEAASVSSGRAGRAAGGAGRR